MTRKSRRELKREVNDLTDAGADTGSGILIVYEGDDGTTRGSDGEPIPDGAVNNANLVLHYEPKKST